MEYLSVGGLDSLTSSIEVPGLGCSCVLLLGKTWLGKKCSKISWHLQAVVGISRSIARMRGFGIDCSHTQE
jgi:hypothetical protein